MRRLCAAFGIYCAGFCAAFDRSPEMVAGNLQIMLVCHGFSVAQPCSNHVDRESFNQFSLSTGSHVLPGFLPDFQSGPSNDFL